MIEEISYRWKINLERLQDAKNRLARWWNFKEFFTSRELRELFLFSTFIFILCALLVQFLLTFMTAFLLRHYSISFSWSIFWIKFPYYSFEHWSMFRIYFVNSAGMLVLFFTGAILVDKRFGHWKWRLIITWLTFILINILPTGLLAGIFWYNEFGIAYIWLFQSIIARSVIAIIAMLIIIFFKPYWIQKFLETTYTTAFLSDGRNIEKYIKYCMILPWIAGTMVLLAFGIPKHAWFWMVSLLGLGFVILPVYPERISPMGIEIYKTGKKIFPVRNPLIFIIIILLVLWIASFYKISF
jgi:hypothetical protein